MKTDTRVYITKEMRSDFGFISEQVQRGRTKPKKYKHYVRMPYFLYEEITKRGIINAEDYFIDESAFFEFGATEVTINFICLYAREDLQRKIDHYLIVKFAGSYPLTIGGVFF